MNELEKCLELRRRITETEEMLEDISCCIRYPKVQAMSDSPKSTSPFESSIERYIVKQEKFENQKLLLETELNMVWNTLMKRLIMLRVGKPERKLMYLRFNRGYSWKECGAIMKDSEGEMWNSNRVFRTYRKICVLLQKDMQKVSENAN